MPGHIQRLRLRIGKTENEKTALERERKIQDAAITIRKKYGKNAILKTMNLE